MSNTNRIEKIEDETEEEMIDKFLQYFNDKYGIPKEVLMESLDKSSIKYTLNKYKFNIEDINYEIESKTINRKDGGDSDKNDVIDGIKSFFARLEKSQEENINNNDINLSSNNKQKNVDNRKMLKKKPEPKNAPAKNKEMKIQINSNINIKYNSSIVYNLGENQMEKQFNPVNIITDINGLKIIDSYQLLPKDSTVERIGYENYFKNFKNNLLRELKIPEDDPLLGETKFVLFVAFDVIDQKPNFDDLVGIDPLNDYKKYVLKIDINDPNLFLASGQIIFLEGDLIENGKTIEVRHFINGYTIKQYGVSYEQIIPFYSHSSDPYSLYCMFGPYFSKDDVDLTVFHNVIREVANKNPHYFLVNGPFFSTENNKVKYGEIDTEKGMEDIINLLKNEFSQTRTQIIICPGISDNENYYPIPQPPFDKVNNNFVNYGKDQKIIFLSNPQIFPFNEAYIGIANFDSVKDTVFNSIHAKNINTFEKACEMMLYQKNLYPILPNTLMANYEKNQERTISMNLANYNFLNFDDNQPDIIFINSAMKSCAIKVHGTVFINCGSFCKGKKYEQIAKLTLHRPVRIDEKNSVTDVYKRLKVEFIKINADNNINDNNSKTKK